MARLSRNPIDVCRRAALAALALVALGAVPAAGEWSQAQGGPGHSGALADGPAPPYRVAWTFHAPDGTVSGAIVTGQVAVTVGHHAVYGIGLDRGEIVWRLLRNGGPLSMPAMGEAGGRRVLVFVDQAPVSGTSIVGVDLRTLREIWRTPLRRTSRSGVTVADSSAYVADDGGNVYALDLATGALRWSASTIGEVLTPPAVADGLVVVVSRDVKDQRSELVALDEATGRPAWPAFSAPVSGSTGSGAAVADGRVVAGFSDRVVRELSARDGTPQWGALGLSLFSPANLPALTSRRVYIADVGAGLYALDAATGARLWDYQLNDLVVRSSPVISGGSVLLGLNDGRLVAIDAASGDLVWQSPPSQGLIGAIALSRALVIAVKGGSRPGLVAYEHDPDGVLLHEPSPTLLNAGRLVGNYALALVVAFALLLIPFRLLARRLGPALLLPAGSPEREDWESLEPEDRESGGEGEGERGPGDAPRPEDPNGSGRQ